MMVPTSLPLRVYTPPREPAYIWFTRRFFKGRMLIAVRGPELLEVARTLSIWTVTGSSCYSESNNS
jgi:hypothetical protein